MIRISPSAVMAHLSESDTDYESDGVIDESSGAIAIQLDDDTIGLIGVVNSKESQLEQLKERGLLKKLGSPFDGRAWDVIIHSPYHLRAANSKHRPPLRKKKAR